MRVKYFHYELWVPRFENNDENFFENLLPEGEARKSDLIS